MADEQTLQQMITRVDRLHAELTKISREVEEIRRVLTAESSSAEIGSFRGEEIEAPAAHHISRQQPTPPPPPMSGSTRRS
jgi:hypothetical protein